MIKKLVNFALRIFNPPFFRYSVYHNLRKDVSKEVACKIWKKNKKQYLAEERDFVVDSYDGSNQWVHPDVSFFDGLYWFVATPYPYGMEEYENPCVYFAGGGGWKTYKD